jgi:amino acid transporter
VTTEPRLRRVLGRRDLIVVAAAAMGPAFSIATTMAAMIASAGAWTWLALAIVVALMAMVAVGYKQLGERMRDAGSSYAWIRTAFGPEAGAYGAWVLLIANIFAVLATALPAGTYTLDLLAPGLASNGVAVALVASAWTVGSALLLWYGLRPTAMLAFALLVAEMVVLAGAAAVSALHPHSDAVAFAATLPSWSGIAGAVVVGIWMVDGWEVSASTAEEARGDAAAPGWGGLVGLLLTGAVLLGAIAAFSRVGSTAGYDAHQADALAYVGGLLGGAWPRLLSVIVLVSLAASLQTTLVYLSRSFYAMGRDGLLHRTLGRLDHRGEPAPAILLVSGLSVAFCLASGMWPTAAGAFGIALQGTSWFLGALFAMSAAAAVRLFLREPDKRWTGVILPGLGAVALALVLGEGFVHDDPGPRVFIAVSAIFGLPLALWRGRAVRRTLQDRAGSLSGVAFERQRNRFDP